MLSKCLQVKCLEFSLAVVYIVFISVLLLWGLLHRKRVREGPSSKTNPLVNMRDESEPVDKQETPLQPVQVCNDFFTSPIFHVTSMFLFESCRLSRSLKHECFVVLICFYCSLLTHCFIY